MPSVMELEDIEVHFSQTSGVLGEVKEALFGTGKTVRAVDGVDLSLEENKVQGIIGESGCGKTTLLETLVGLQQPTNGRIYFEGEPISEFSKKRRRQFNRDVQMIFQDPFNSLDPKYTVSETLGEQLKIHGMENSEEKKLETLERVELNPSERYVDQRPDQLSGGEKQRVSIARALIVEPEVLLADEPVSMLDVSTQASILNLLSRIVSDEEVAMLYISHDISTVSQICDMMNIMYLGRIVETGQTKAVLSDPKHPYTKSLIQAVPIPDPEHNRERVALEGDIPDSLDIPLGCRFKDRCPERMPICDQQPLDWGIDDDREVACHLYYDHERETGRAAVTDGETVSRDG